MCCPPALVGPRPHRAPLPAGAWPANECVTAYVDAAPGGTRGSAILSLTDPFTARADNNLNDGWGFRSRPPHRPTIAT